MPSILLTCNPGTEDIVLEEAKEKLSARPIEIRERHGRLVVETPINGILLFEKIYEMRTIHYAGILLSSGVVNRRNQGLEEIRKLVRQASPELYVSEYSAYAVRSVREGEHSFTSMDISRAVGDEISKILESTGIKPYVRLASPTILFRADLIENNFYLSLSLTGDQSRHIRGIRLFDHPAALKSSLAAVMLRMAGYQDKEKLIDPMCGSGTIAIEAALTSVEGDIYCNDKSKRHITSARRNAIAAGVAWRIVFTVSDVIELLSKGNEYDVIISNPPYGIRLGDPWTVRRLYERFAKILPYVLSPKGRATIITTEHRFLERISPQVGLKIKERRIVRHGDLWVKILVLNKDAS